MTTSSLQVLGLVLSTGSEDEDRREQDDAGLNERNVALVDRREEQSTDPRIAEDRLDDDDASLGSRLDRWRWIPRQ